MFQALIDQAHDMIERLYACAEKGRSEVPLAVAIRYSEFEAWETTAFGIINTIFGPDSAEVARWRALTDRRSMLLVEARRNDLKRGEFFGLIDYFNLAAGVLREYEAVYQHDKAAQASASTAADTQTSVSSNGSANLAPLHTQELPHQPVHANPSAAQEKIAEPPIARRVAANQWDVVVSVNNDVYSWLSDMAALRDRATPTDGSAVARLMTTIIERVVLQTQRSRTRTEAR